MNAIFGFIQRDGAPVAPATMDGLRQSAETWGGGPAQLWQNGCAGLGQAGRRAQVITQNGLVFTAAARVDNRAELVNELLVTNDELPMISDAGLMFRAYTRWGPACVERIYGDWSFAAWHPAERRLFLARDHYGNTAMYYHAGPRVFAFATSYKSLLALNLIPREMDELYFAQVLVSWDAYHGERTIYPALKRLPPAHTLTVTSNQLETNQYWYVENTPLLHLPHRRDYVEAFREVFDQAVRASLRTEPGEEDGIASTLSGGLDSSAITATAAGMLREQGRRLLALTSTPLFDTRPYVGQRFGDEFPLAQATAQLAGNIDHVAVTAESLTPVQAIRQMLEIHGEPAHAAGNFFWLLDLEQTARARGCRVLLTGQNGNAALSWAGDIFSQPPAFQIRQLGWQKWAKERAKRAIPADWFEVYRRYRLRGKKDRLDNTALNPALARRLNLLELRLNDPDSRPARTALENRRFLQPGRSFVGALHAQTGAAHGLDVRDPSGDARLLAFSFSVPDHIFMEPESGLNRWLIRAAMQGRLPDEVRLNQNRGRQAGDLAPRLRACAVEVETALAEIERGPAAAYVNAPHMRRVWQLIQTEDTPEAFRQSVTVLTRGLMAGLFVNGLEKGTF